MPRATWIGPCHGCPEQIQPGDHVVLKGRDWYHAGCVSGGDES